MSKLKATINYGLYLLNEARYSLGTIAFGISILFLLTKLSALIKTQVLTALYGIQSRELDIFNAANIIAEFIFSVVVIGSVNSTIIPLLAQIQNKDENVFTKITSTIINFYTLLLLIICFVIIVFANQLAWIIKITDLPGINNNLNQDELNLFTSMLRVLMFSPIILSISTLYSSVLQIKKSFWITAIAPAFYNIGIIIFALLSIPFNKNPMILAYGVVCASFLHLLVQLPAIHKKGLKYSLTFDFRNPYLTNALKNAIPQTIGVMTEYIVFIFQSFVALNAVTGTLNAFRLASSIKEIPYSLIGLSITLSVFPKISELAYENKVDDFKRIISEAIRKMVILLTPIICVLIVLRTPISQLLFGLFEKGGDFQGTNMISYALLFLSISILFVSINGLLNRTFYALGDVKTPTIIKIISSFVELICTYGLVNLFSHFDESLSLDPIYFILNFSNYFSSGNSPAAIGGIALAVSIGSFVNFALLFFFLNKRIKVTEEMHRASLKIISGILSIMVGFLFFKITNNFFETTKVVGVLLTTINSTTVILLSFYLFERIIKDEDVKFIENLITKTKSNVIKLFKLIKKINIVGVNTS